MSFRSLRLLVASKMTAAPMTTTPCRLAAVLNSSSPLTVWSGGAASSSAGSLSSLPRGSRMMTTISIGDTNSRIACLRNNLVWESLVNLSVWFIKRTFQPSLMKRKRRMGFLVRQRTVGGRNVLKRRRAKGRRRLDGGI